LGYARLDALDRLEALVRALTQPTPTVAAAVGAAHVAARLAAFVEFIREIEFVL
jgi:hypothetical protein